MHYFSSLVLLALSLPLVAHSKSLFIDSSCTSKPGWDDYWKETQKLAKRAGERMDSATDTDFEAVFKRIFQTEKGSTEGQYARGKRISIPFRYFSINPVFFCAGILKDIAELSPVTDLKTSEIRLFCDNDQRWGSARRSGGWYDKVKYVRGHRIRG